MLIKNNLYRECFDSIDSTHKYSIREIETISSLLKTNSIVCFYANTQTDGVGKVGRRWESSRGNFHATYSIELPHKSSNTELIQRATLSVLLALDSYGIKCEIKWLNDLLVNDKKVCGVLCDLIEYNGTVYLLIGIGINLINHPTSLQSTSIYHSIGKTIDYSDLIDKCADTIQTCFNITRRETLEIWHSRMAYLNRNIMCTHNNIKLFGKLLGINSDGDILIDSGDKLLTMNDCTIELRSNA